MLNQNLTSFRFQSRNTRCYFQMTQLFYYIFNAQFFFKFQQTLIISFLNLSFGAVTADAIQKKIAPLFATEPNSLVLLYFCVDHVSYFALAFTNTVEVIFEAFFGEKS